MNIQYLKDDSRQGKHPLPGSDWQTDPLQLERNMYYHSTENAWFPEILQKNQFNSCHDSMVFCAKRHKVPCCPLNKQ